jgi:hypothetical protein
MDVVARGGDGGHAALRGLGDGADGGAGGDRVSAVAGGHLELADEAVVVLWSKDSHDDGDAEIGGLVEEAQGQA